MAEIRTSEDVVISAVGRELYELFFRGYTRKQWGIDPSELDKSVTARIPTRTNTDDRYFSDKHQIMPADGYTAMFEAMLDHPNIERLLGTDWRDVKDEIDADHIIYTGPVDEYFDFRFGKLPYRSLRFEHRTLDQEQFQPVATVNYPDEAVPYTRITEYKHLTGQEHPQTSITYEYPSAEGDPYYPIPRPENQALYKRYEALADATPGVTFVGRLATYRYYNMDQVVGQALAAFRKLDGRSGKLGRRFAAARRCRITIRPRSAPARPARAARRRYRPPALRSRGRMTLPRWLASAVQRALGRGRPRSSFGSWPAPSATAPGEIEPAERALVGEVPDAGLAVDQQIQRGMAKIGHIGRAKPARRQRARRLLAPLERAEHMMREIVLVPLAEEGGGPDHQGRRHARPAPASPPPPCFHHRRRAD